MLHLWHIYLQNWVIFRVNVGKYSSTMEHMGEYHGGLVNSVLIGNFVGSEPPGRIVDWLTPLGLDVEVPKETMVFARENSIL